MISAVQPGHLLAGNERWPTRFRLRDQRLSVVTEGITPAVLRLVPGLYEIEVHNLHERQREIFEVAPGSTCSITALGMPVDTAVPVHNARHRSQNDAEFVTRLSAQLRHSGASSGLVVVILPCLGVNGTPKIAGWTVQLLESAHRVYGDVRLTWVSTNEGATGAAVKLDPGGHILRVDHSSDQHDGHFEIPLWVSTGYQTILFLPWSEGPDLAAMSFHMVPATSVWTGFDVASGMVELALANLREGRRPFGVGGHSPLNFPQLAAANPIVGLLRIVDLQAHSGEVDSTETALIGRLTNLISDHPDLAVLARRRNLWGKVRSRRAISFPPMTAAGHRVIAQMAATGAGSVAPGSLLDISLRLWAPVGPWSSWPVSREEFMREVGLEWLRPGDPPALSLPLGMIDLKWFVSRAPRTRAVVAGLLVAFLLRRMDEQSVQALLRAVDLDPVRRRVRSYLADLISAGRSRRARLLLLGGVPARLAAATGVSKRTAVQAMDEVRKELRRSLSMTRRKTSERRMRAQP